MFKEITHSISFGKQTITLKTGKIARNTTSSVLASIEDTVVLCTLVVSPKPKKDATFFPLSVHYREMLSAVGKIPGGFNKREGKPSDQEVLISRLIDRPIRPLFGEHFFNEVQIICTVMSYDQKNNPDIVAMIGTFAALATSGINNLATLGAVRVGYVDNQFVVNHNQSTSLDLVLAASRDSIMMIEAQSKDLPQSVIAEAVSYGHQVIKSIVDGIDHFAELVQKSPNHIPRVDIAKLQQDIHAQYGQRIKDVFLNDAAHIENSLDLIKSEVLQSFASESYVELALEFVKSDVLRSVILEHKRRVDKRRLDEVRQIESEVGVLPRSHGSSLFTRGQTQVMVTATLGSSSDEQIVESFGKDTRERFMLHYNFPPYAVCDTSQPKAPGRREIGHGRLAHKALLAVLPSKDSFDYTVRIVADVTESNGSTSMATVCGASMALMHSGVPIDKHVAGIAMGLIKENDQYVVLSDIMAIEDFLGDMDFKVAGTRDGITALQMDIKVPGIDYKIVADAISQARPGLNHILDKMYNVISTPVLVSSNVPISKTLKIDKNKIRELIGPGGSVVKKICEVYNVKVDIADTGLVKVMGLNSDVEKAMNHISKHSGVKGAQDGGHKYEAGAMFEIIVAQIADHGIIFHDESDNRQFVHISDIFPIRVRQISDHINIGDTLKAKYIGIDSMGRLKFNLKDNFSGLQQQATQAAGSLDQQKPHVSEKKYFM